MWWKVSLAALAISGLPVDGEMVRLGGLREAQAEIRTVGSDYVIVVRFLAVRTFDKATNRRLNVGKGRNYALLALARHLGGGRSVQLSLSGLRVDDQGEQNRYHRVRVTVSRNKVKVRTQTSQEDANPPKRSTKRNKNESRKETLVATIDVRFDRTSPLLARKQDYVDTIAELFVASNDELSNIKSIQAEDRFLNAIVDVEEKYVGQLNVLSKQIAADRFLLSNERGDLRNEMDERQSTLFATMRTLVKSKVQSEKRKEGEK